MKNRYQILTSVKNWYQIIRYDKWVSILTHVKNWYQIITHMKNCYLIVTDVSDKTVKNWNRMQNAVDWVGGGGGILSILLGISMYAIGNLTSCVFFTKCEILVRNM